MADAVLGKLPDKYQDNTTDLMDKHKLERTKVMEEAHKKLIEKAREGKPFCKRCFKKDYEEQQEKEYPRQRHEVKDMRDTKIKYDMTPYAKEDRFNKLKSRTVTKFQRIDGEKVPWLRAEYICFQCRECSGRLDVQVEKDPETVSKDHGRSTA